MPIQNQKKTNRLSTTILNYFAAFTETKFNFRTLINYRWTNNELTLDLSIFQDFQDIILQRIKSGDNTPLTVKSNEHIISLSGDKVLLEINEAISDRFGLDYPGGPLIDKICREYEGDYIEFTSGLKNDKKNKYNFSYSGLKTAVYYYYKKNPNTELNKILKGFQIAAIKILVEKTASLCEATGIKEVVIGGGVAANSYLRDLFLNKKDLKVHLPDISLCMDNGAMTACAAYYRSRSGQFDPLDFDVYSKPKGGPAAYLKKRSVHFSV